MHTGAQTGLWSNPNGEARLGTACQDANSRDTFWNIETNAVTQDQWTFITITVTNATQQGTEHRENPEKK